MQELLEKRNLEGLRERLTNQPQDIHAAIIDPQGLEGTRNAITLTVETLSPLSWCISNDWPQGAEALLTQENLDLNYLLTAIQQAQKSNQKKYLPALYKALENTIHKKPHEAYDTKLFIDIFSKAELYECPRETIETFYGFIKNGIDVEEFQKIIKAIIQHGHNNKLLQRIVSNPPIKKKLGQNSFNLFESFLKRNEDHPNTLKILLDHYPSIELCSPSKIPLLNLLIDRQLLKSAAFVASRVNVNEQDPEGNSAAHIATQQKNISMLTLLNENAADFYLKNKAGEHPQKPTPDEMKAANLSAIKGRSIPKEKFTKLSFGGGGVKGRAFLAAVSEMIEQDYIDLSQVTHTGGTSAGAITGLLLGLRYTPEEMTEMFDERSFEDLLDSKNTHLRNKILEQVRSGESELSFLTAFKHMKSVRGAHKELKKHFGLFRGTAMQDQIIEWIKNKLPEDKKQLAENITFTELAALQNAKGEKLFCDMTFCATNLNTQRSEFFSLATTPNACVADVVSASMRIPVIYDPMHIRSKDTGTQNITPSAAFYADGGILCNTPHEAIPGALTFTLLSPAEYDEFVESTPPEFTDIGEEKLGGLAMALVKALRHKEKEILAKTKPPNIIFIPTNQKTIDLDLTLEKKQALDEAGKKAARQFIATQTPTQEQLPELKNTSFHLLLTHKVLQKIPNSLSFELSGAPLSGNTVFEIYKNISFEELPRLRKLVNPNERNAEEKSALAIAAEHEDKETIIKLRLAGALPSAQNLPLSPETKKDKTRFFTDSPQNYIAFFEPYIASGQIAKGAKRLLKNYYAIPIVATEAISTIIDQRTQKSLVLHHLTQHLPGKLPPAQLATFFEQKIEKETNAGQPTDKQLKERVDFLKSPFLQRS